MSEKIKYMDIKEFMDSGMLFEINRQILHPLGMALEATGKDGEDGEWRLSGVWDYRDDPEGILFDQETLQNGKEKLQRYMEKEGNAKLDEREQALGFIIQT